MQRPRTWWQAHTAELAAMPTTVFVEAFDVHITAVVRWRRVLGVATPPHKRGAKFAGVDWGKSNAEIARELGVTVAAVRGKRLRLSRRQFVRGE